MTTLTGLMLAMTVAASLPQHTHPTPPTTGSAAMGFSQTATSHHFRLSPLGGSIDVHVNDPADIATRDQVRQHLQIIARDFAQGRYALPFAVHAELPPGAETMAAHRASMTFAYEEGALGGRVIVSTSDPVALAALHDFLRYQIREHRTGDSLDVLK